MIASDTIITYVYFNPVSIPPAVHRRKRPKLEDTNLDDNDDDFEVPPPPELDQIDRIKLKRSQWSEASKTTGEKVVDVMGGKN